MTVRDRETELVAKSVAGDRVAIQQLLVSHGSRILTFVEKRLAGSVRDVIDPEDIVQQTFAQAYQSISRFRKDEGTFLSWLTGIAENKVKDAIKTRQRDKRGGRWRRVREAATDSSPAEDLVTLLSKGHTPSVSAMNHEAVRAVRAAIDALPEEQRVAVQLRLLEGKHLDECAQIMNRSPRAVQGLVDRARKKLRATLGRLSKYE
jgi:RNA polymerase sigma-70 factor (ECF subfamily)